MSKRPIYKDEKPKLSLRMSPIGNYHLADIDWDVEFYVSTRRVTIPKAACEMLDADTYAVRVDTSKLAVGTLRGILYPQIPDPDVEGGIYIPPVPFETGEPIVDKYQREDGMCHC